jgi:integrase
LKTPNPSKQLADASYSMGTKDLASDVLANYYRFRGRYFSKPNYVRVEKLPFIPLEAEIDSLISGSGPKMSAFLQTLKETGVRCGEGWNLGWRDIDTERGLVTVTPEKGSRPRQFKISPKPSSMLSKLPHKGVLIFGTCKMEAFRRNYEVKRRSLAGKLANPRLHQITLHTFRHWKATSEYHKTHDILHVMQLLGHKNIKNTLIYTHLVDWKSEDFVCKVAKNLQEASSLIEAGFEYVTEIEGVKLFRKRK